MPLHLFCVQEAVAARVRLDEVLEYDWHGTSHTKRHCKSHMNFLDAKLQEYGLRPEQMERCNRLEWERGFRTNWDSFDGHAKHRQPTQVNVYTDGSKLDGQTGAGIAIYDGTTEQSTEWYRLPDYATVFQAEVTAVSRAAETLSALGKDRVKYVKIFIDSQAAISAIGNPRIKSIAVARAITSLNTLAKMAKCVTLVWIPAHKGYLGNERADELAKRGSAETDVGLKLAIGKPCSELKRIIRENTYKAWSEERSSSRVANHTKGFYEGPNQGKAKFVYKLARLELGRFVRVVTGHNNLNFFQAKLGLHNTAICRLCGEGNETITHFIGACPVLMNQTGELFADRIPDAGMRWSVRDLLNFSYIPEVNAAYEGSWADGERTCDEEAMDLASSWPWAETGRVTDDNNNGPPATLTITQDK